MRYPRTFCSKWDSSKVQNKCRPFAH